MLNSFSVSADVDIMYLQDFLLHAEHARMEGHQAVR